MHSIHPMQTQSDHQDTMQQTTIEPQQQQHQMTVLESLNPGGEQQNSSYQPAEEQIFLESGQQPNLHQLETNHGAQMAEQQHLRSNGSDLRQSIEGSASSSIVPINGPILQWLLDKYEIAEGESLPRSLVYNHYLSHCRSLRMASVNAASFGKMIRSVFLGLKTRRLGTRGHSKYHYFGIRAKQHTQQELLQHGESSSSAAGLAGCSGNLMSLNNNDNSNQNLTDNGSDETGSPGNNQDNCNGRLSSNSGSAVKRVRRTSGHQLPDPSQSYPNHMMQQQLMLHQQHQDDQQQLQATPMGVSGNGVVYYSTNGYSVTNGYTDNKANQISHAQQQQQHHYDLTDFRNHLGANWVTLVDEHWPAPVAELSNVEFMELFEIKYRLFYKRMIELLSELKFLDVEQLWQEFWHPAPTASVEDKAQQRWSPMSSQVVDPQQHQPHQQQQQQQVVGAVTSQTASPTSLQSQPSDIIYQMDYNQQQQQQQQELTFHQLYQLTSQAKVIERINQIDYILYEAIESFLLPDKLSPIPRFLYQQIKLFAKNFALWIELAIKDFDLNFVHEKSKSARAFGSALIQSTKLNHLSTASRAIWEKRSSLAQMSIDLSRVDLRDIEHQVYLMNSSGGGSASGSSLHKSLSSSGLNLFSNNTANEDNTSNENIENSATNNGNHHQHHHHQHQHLCAIQPDQLIQNFLHLLEDPYPANSWPDWCRNLVESRVCGLSLETIREEATNFVLKYNFCISLITKELTLKSAPSFGSFHLIRLLFDEYISCLLVTRLAQAQKMTPAQLLGSQ